MRNDKSRFLVGLLLLLLAAVGGISLLSQKIGKTEMVSQEGFAEKTCNARSVFYKASGLYNIEKTANSSRARAFDIILSNGDNGRVLLDYTVSSANVKAKVVFTNNSSHEIRWSRASLLLESDDLKAEKAYRDAKIAPGDSTIFEISFDSSKILSDSRKLNLTLSSNKGCQIMIDGALDINKNDTSVGYIDGISRNNEPGRLTFESGYNYLGFSDWRPIKSISSKNLNAFGYDGKTKTWERVDSLMEPGKGYLVVNPDSRPANVVVNTPFWIANEASAKVIDTGWNLLYNDSGQDISFDKIKLSFFKNEDRGSFYDSEPVSVESLISSNLASSQIYLAKDQGYELLDSNSIPSGAVYWFYVFAKPNKIEVKSFDLDFMFQGGGDTYQAGQAINFGFALYNNDSIAHSVISSSVNDRCTYGIKITDSSNNIIFNDRATSGCPSWPNLTLLQPGQKIDYNYSWTIPQEAHGKYKVSAYYNYTRNVFNEGIIKSAVINIK